MSDKSSNVWVMEERPHEFVGVHADRVRVESGALIFENGAFLDSELVLAQAPGTWLSVHPRVEDDDDCMCDGDHE